MPIKPIVLQRRHAELGRIRLGYKAPVGDEGKSRPAKLEMFRFTSVSERYIKDLAELYGGEARPWDNGGIASWEVYTEAKSIPVIAVKGGLSQWLEFWSGGGCIHRCDGETNVLTGHPCDLEEKAQVGRKIVNPHTEAKPTTRLSLMLPELEAIGVWRLESKGWNAAAEIPAVAELAQYVGDLVPAHLHLVERRAVKDGKTSRFVVPVLDLHIGTARLREIVAEKSGMAELQAATSDRPALEAGSIASEPDPYTPFFEQVAATTVVDDLADIWDAAREAGLVGSTALDSARHRDFVAAWKAKAHELKPKADSPPAGEAQPDAEGIVDAELVDDGDADAIWQQVLLAGGKQGMTTPDLEDDFASKMGGLSSAQASAAELKHYLGLLTEGAAA